MGTGFISIQMDPLTKESGRMISNMGSELKSGTTAAATLDNIRCHRSKARASTYGPMAIGTSEIGIKMSLMEKESTSGQMEGFTVESGSRT